MPEATNPLERRADAASQLGLKERAIERRLHEHRMRLIDAGKQILEALSALNLHGDAIDHRIATQAPGLPYGDIYTGLVELCEILWPGQGQAIVSDVHANGTTLRESATFLALRTTRTV